MYLWSQCHGASAVLENHRLAGAIGRRQLHGAGDGGKYTGVVVYQRRQAEKPEPQQSRKEVLDRTRKRYFRPEAESDDDSVSARPFSGGWFFRGLLDYIAGILLAAATFLYFHSYIAAGAAAASFGVVIGLVEIFLRGRDPSIIKLIFFMGTGAALYVYGYYFL